MTRQIKFTVSGCWIGHCTMEIFIDDDNSCKIDSKFYSTISDEQIAELDALNIFAWEKEYIYPMFDGIQWSLTLIEDHRTIYCGRGSNAYPKNFDAFISWLDKILEKAGANKHRAWLNEHLNICAEAVKRNDAAD